MLRISIFLIYTIFLTGLFQLHGQSGPDNHKDIVISWDIPRGDASQKAAIAEVLFFEGAVYNDSVPGIPLYHHREKNSIPHFSYRFRLLNEQYVPVDEHMRNILEAAGLRQLAPRPEESIQWERMQPYTVVSFYPFRYNPETSGFEKLVSFSLEKNVEYNETLSYETLHSYKSSSVLAEGSWYKVCVDQTGLYRLEYSDLVSMGIPVAGLQKGQIRLFGNGGGMLAEANSAPKYDDLEENAIFVSGASEGSFGQNDYILFYGQSPNQWKYNPQTRYYDHQVHLYSKENCYFISVNQGQGKRISSQASLAGTSDAQITTFPDYAYHQQDLQSLIGSGRVWYGEVFEGTLSRDFSFAFSDINTNMPTRAMVNVAARSPVLSSFAVRASGSESTIAIPSVNLLDDNNFYAQDGTGSLVFNPELPNNVSIRLTYNRPASTARGWLNYVAVNVNRNLRFSGSQMAFRNPIASSPIQISEYILGNAPAQVVVWDVTDRFNIRRQEVVQNGSNQHFKLNSGTQREFLAFNGSAYLKPRLGGLIQNQNLHGMQSKDLIIVSADEFLPEAKRLAAFRTDNDGLSIGIVTPRQVYNEFSSGAADASAIRNFIKMFYDRAQNDSEFPRYLLLFGNGTIDNKNNLGFGGNFIPTYQSEASLSPSNSYMTDDYFGLLADSEGDGAAGLLDLGIGRLPVRTLEEAKILVDKLIRYDQRIDGMESGNGMLMGGAQISNYADWRNMVVFVADDGDFNTHFSHAERLTEIVRQGHPYYNLEKIYLDAYPITTLAGGSRYPDVNRAINDRVNKGAILINYIGHGGTKGLAHERVVTFDDIATWGNYYNMPVFMTATCEFSSFDQPDPELLSAGVRILLKHDGGAIALYTTTRLAWAGTNLTLNENFMKNVFSTDAAGNYPRLGDLIRIAKVQSQGNVQPWRLKNFVLLGDPSMQMAYPRHRVVTETMTDTINAFGKATVTGYIADRRGNKLTGYNGVLYPTVYDKYSQYQTLANASGSIKANFTIRNSMLYKGKASIVDGEFSFSFVVPKDIAYQFGQGKISYYADNGTMDAHGFYSDFIIGGTLDQYEPDFQGPAIRLFLNDTTFISGGKTNENPLLLAYLSDENGINISGRIGHDIVAYLNDQLTSPIVLNSYYEADTDSYQSGRVRYPFYRLDEGQYTLSLRVWDIHNNPSVESIDFIVARSAQMVLENLLNYPNPLGHQGTNFIFSHNLPFTDLEILIDIFDMQGRALKSIRTRVQSAGFQSPAIHWDGTTDGGKLIGNGVYLYRIGLKTPDGQQTYKTEKLVIVRE